MPDKTVPVAGKGDFFSTLVQKLNAAPPKPEDHWSAEAGEGQLAVDVAQTDDKLVIVATIAGAKPEDVTVNINNDVLTIRGKREADVEIKKDDYFYRECYWGKFSRTIVLPVEVKADLASAEFKNGVLIIRIPKQRTDAKVPVVIVDD